MSVMQTLKFWDRSNPFDDLADALAQIRGDHDVVVLFPYDDGTFWLKGATFQKDLIGGQGGYETDDGDKIVVDGDGEPKRDLLGVPMVLAVDPTEHAAAVDPIKALVAQKHNIGEWIRVDSKGTIIEVGEALEQASEAAATDTDLPALSDLDVGPMHSEDVKEKLREMNVSPEQATQQHVRKALEALAEAGKLRKIMDIAPPAAPTLRYPEDNVAATDGGVVERASGLQGGGDGDEPAPAAVEAGADVAEDAPEPDDDPAMTGPGMPVVDVEEATHIAVDQSKAADLLPTTTSSTELNVAIDKARMEEHEEGKMKTTLIHGIIIGAVLAGVMALMMGGLFALL